MPGEVIPVEHARRHDGRRGRWTGAWGRNKYGLFFVAPWLVGFLAFNLVPIAYSLFLSFTNYDIFTAPELTGLRNYVFTKDVRFLKALSVTARYVFIGVPLQLLVALILALALNRNIPGLSVFRALYYLPALLGGSVAISILWRQVFGSDGIVNALLAWMGFSEEISSTSWVAHPFYTLYTLILLRMWQFGSPMIIFLAGLKQVPEEYYESAEMDGASAFRQFRQITLPMITPIVLFNVVMQIISAFQAFTPAYIVGGAGGGVMDSLLFYTLYLYNVGFTYFRMGLASAMAWVLLVIIAILTALAFRTSNRWVYYDS
jgi:multiple sugar transport system permease protein